MWQNFEGRLPGITRIAYQRFPPSLFSSLPSPARPPATPSTHAALPPIKLHEEHACTWCGQNVWTLTLYTCSHTAPAAAPATPHHTSHTRPHLQLQEADGLSWRQRLAILCHQHVVDSAQPHALEDHEDNVAHVVLVMLRLGDCDGLHRPSVVTDCQDVLHKRAAHRRKCGGHTLWDVCARKPRTKQHHGYLPNSIGHANITADARRSRQMGRRHRPRSKRQPRGIPYGKGPGPEGSQEAFPTVHADGLVHASALQRKAAAVGACTFGLQQHDPTISWLRLVPKRLEISSLPTQPTYPAYPAYLPSLPSLPT
eukprot:360046-Chlamydomonas_euryale.AAC.2